MAAGQQPGQPSGWGTPAWGWPAPTVKPGVIPLRQIGIGEILDGAVTTIRRNPGPMLGLSAAAAIVIQLIGLAASWIMFGELQTLAELPATATGSQILSALGGTFGSFIVLLVVSWVAITILSGILTVVVGRAVLGQSLTVGEAWAKARSRLLRLLLLTVVYIVIWFLPVTVITSVAVAVSTESVGAAVALGFVGGPAAVLCTVWLYVRYALAAPALMLESTLGRAGHAGDTRRPIGVLKALSRSAELVTRSWWRTFFILLLVLIIVIIVSQVVGLLFSVPVYFLADPFDPETWTSFGVLALSALGGIISTTITAPFVAGAVALLYVDRRIRREALDIELARAAGVTIPSRTEPPPPMR